MIGQKFHRLLVLELSDKTDKSKNKYYICKCDCGNITKPIYKGNLIREKSKSCGCLNKELILTRNFLNLSNKKFGRLLVTPNYEKIGKRRYYECICDCGNTTKVEVTQLTSCKTKSCGCLSRELTSVRQSKNLLNQEFGLLKVISKYKIDKNNHIIWKCLCKCGTITLCNSSNLIRNKTKSCGCRKRGNQTHGTIYGIYDNQENLVYIGQTVCDLKNRLIGHINSSTSKMKTWINSINYIPIIKAIEQNIKINNLKEKEIYWITYYKPVLNTQHL